MTTKQKWAIALSVLAIVAIWYFWDDIANQWKVWFPKEEGAEGDAERKKVVYDRLRCCTPSNPCGWSGSTFKNVCG